MPWLKKNLTLVLGGLVGLVLLGGSGFFLFSQSSREGSINTSLEEKKTEWTRLNGLTPYPDEKNIKAIKEEAARVEKLASALKESIRPVEVAPVTDTYSLKLLIETTIDQLKKEAEAAGVNLPDRYAFTFQKLREMPQFESNGIPKIAEQVSQISTLCRILFDAKIHSLDTLRRSPVLKEEGGTSDYLTKKGVTNQWVVRTPYDLSFKSFSTELASVLRGLAALPQCVVIKTINIEPTTLSPQGGSPSMIPMTSMIPQPGMTPGGAGPGGMDPALAARYGLAPGGRAAAESAEGGAGGGGMDAAMRSRYGLGPPGAVGGGEAMRSRYGMGGGGGLGGRYGMGGPAIAPPPALSSPTLPAAPAAPAGPSVVLDEKPLRIILQVDFVKPKPEAEPARRAPRPAVPNPESGDGSADGAGGSEAQ